MSEVILIPCPNCSHPLKVRGEYLGRRATCNRCQAVITLDAPKKPSTDSAGTEPVHGTGTALWEPKPSADAESSLKSEVERLKRYISSITKERETLRADLVQAKVEIKVAQSAVERLPKVENELTNAQAELTAATEKADQLTADLAIEKKRFDALRDELQEEHSAKHQDALNQAESHRLDAESWKSRHDDQVTEQAETRRLLDEERNASRIASERFTTEQEALNAQLHSEQSSHVEASRETRARVESLEKERDDLTALVAELQQRLDQEIRSRESIEAASQELRDMLANSTKSNAIEIEKDELHHQSVKALEARVQQLAEDLEASNARREALTLELSERIADAERDQQLLLKAKEFKEQIRTFLGGLGINLPES